MRQSRLGNGETDCILCGEVFRFYHHSQKRCVECAKMTCGKCGREYSLNPATETKNRHHRNSSLTSSSSMSSSMTSLISSALFGGGTGSGGHSTASGHHAGDHEGTVWLCKICAEQREMWKKSGAWFFKVSNSQCCTSM